MFSSWYFDKLLVCQITLAKECIFFNFQFGIPCDENELHTAIVFCIVCCTHLCVECSEQTHSTRTLTKHKRVPISEKPKENPKCSFHPMHLVEFACLEEECKNSPLMCYICKDYGRHVKHRVRLQGRDWEGRVRELDNKLG